MKKGDMVQVYQDPVSKLRPEGKAVLRKPIDQKFGCDERWMVEFTDEPGATYERTVNAADIITGKP